MIFDQQHFCSQMVLGLVKSLKLQERRSSSPTSSSSSSSSSPASSSSCLTSHFLLRGAANSEAVWSRLQMGVSGRVLSVHVDCTKRAHVRLRQGLGHFSPTAPLLVGNRRGKVSGWPASRKRPGLKVSFYVIFTFKVKMKEFFALSMH